ncbi:MAG: hypothetical protein ACRDQA_26015 [Nocardioidaceae bacterium]
MPTATPDQIRDSLVVVTASAAEDIQAVAAQGDSPSSIRALLFVAAPLVVRDYGDGAAALARDWYDQLREAAKPGKGFTPQPVFTVDEDGVARSVAWATQPLYELGQSSEWTVDDLVKHATDESMARLLPDMQKAVASGFRDTIVTNSNEDPEVSGWRRYARTGACKFCEMLADKGAIFTEASVRFAAHGDCHCLAGPSFDPEAPKASVEQYVASQRTRTNAESAHLRDYLNRYYPDSPG